MFRRRSVQTIFSPDDLQDTSPMRPVLDAFIRHSSPYTQRILSPPKTPLLSLPSHHQAEPHNSLDLSAIGSSSPTSSSFMPMERTFLHPTHGPQPSSYSPDSERGTRAGLQACTERLTTGWVRHRPNRHLIAVSLQPANLVVSDC